MAVVSGNITVSSTVSEVKSSGVPGSQTITFRWPDNLNTTTYANGTAANMADLEYAGILSLVASTPQTIDLTALTSQFGTAINFARVNELLLFNHGTNGQTVAMSGGASNPWVAISSGIVTIYPGAMTRFAAPLTTGMVVSGGSKTVKFDPGAVTLDLDVYIIGRSV